MDKEKQREKYGIAGAIATIMQIQMLVELSFRLIHRAD